MKNATIDLPGRLRLFGIDETTKPVLEPFIPVVTRDLDNIMHAFYRVVRMDPQIDKILAATDDKRLFEKQREHWLGLFACDFGDAYIRRTIKVGAAHRKAGGIPSLYSAGYSAMLQEFLRCAADAFSDDDALAGIQAAICKLVMLDMDIAMSSHIRAIFTDTGTRGHAPGRPPTHAAPDAGSVYI